MSRVFVPYDRICSFLRGPCDAGGSVQRINWTSTPAAPPPYGQPPGARRPGPDPRPGRRDPGYDPNTRAKRLDGERFPLALAAGQEVFTGFDDRFDHGLRLIIAGLKQSLPNASNPAEPSTPIRQITSATVH
jgi:TetR/AcrR family transcriptional regulator, tetracycline repressor protein